MLDSVFPGLGTVINVLAIAVGALLGMAVGHRLPESVRSVVTDSLGLVTLLIAGLSVVSVTDPSLAAAVGEGAPTLIILGSLLIGSVTGSALGVERRLGSLAGRVQAWAARRRGSGSPYGRRSPYRGGGAATGDARDAGGVPGRGRGGGTGDARDAGGVLDGGRGGATGDARDAGGVLGRAAAAPDARQRFIEGWLTASLLFCVGPLAILGSLSDGLGRGIEQLVLKSVLDGFAALAFASTFGVGVLLSAVSVAVFQGAFTVVGVLLGSVIPDAHVAALTATGGLLLAGIGMRLLRIREVPVGDMLPALAVAPLLTQLVVLLR